MSWDTMTRKEQLAATHYDFYKDVHGIRPRWYNYDQMSEEELEKELETLSIECEEQENLRREQEKLAAERVENQIQFLIDTGAEDRLAAIRWLHEAEETDGDNEYLCFKLGLPYGYFNGV